MAKTPSTPRDDKKSNSGLDTPPSAKSTGSSNTSSSYGTVVTESTAGGSGTNGSRWPVVDGCKGEEEVEEEELDQEGLPAEMKRDTYIGEAGEIRFIEDLRKYNLEDEYIELSSKGKAHWGKMPTNMHKMAIVEMVDLIRDSQSETIYIDCSSFVNVGKQGVKKYPDVAIWGKERLDEKKRPIDVKVDRAPKLGIPWMNPHVIIEFSWTNNSKEEIPKFNCQMQNHIEELGDINLGFLIKARPSFGSMLAPEESPGDIPVCGFDVFRAETGEHVTTGQPFLQYRVGVNEDAVITIPGGLLGEGEYADVPISLQAIADAIEESGVIFKPEA